jgi:hypothetical protein
MTPDEIDFDDEPPRSRRPLFVVLACVAAAVILVAGGLVIALGRDKEETDASDDPTAAATVATTPAPKASPTAVATAAASAAPAATPSPAETTAAESVPDVAPPANELTYTPAAEYINYCIAFQSNGPAIEAASNNIMYYQPDASFVPEDPNQVWTLVNKVNSDLTPVVGLIDQSVATGPPDYIAVGLMNARAEYQMIIQAFTDVAPGTEGYVGRLMNASAVATTERQEAIQTTLWGVRDQTIALCCNSTEACSYTPSS